MKVQPVVTRRPMNTPCGNDKFIRFWGSQASEWKMTATVNQDPDFAGRIRRNKINGKGSHDRAVYHWAAATR